VTRHLFRFGLFLVLGAIVNVAVAWVCALIAPEYQSSRTPMNVDSWPQPVLKGWPRKPVVFNAYSQISLCFSWEEFRASEEQSAGSTLTKNEFTLQKLWVGLPFRCATGNVWRESHESNSPISVPFTRFQYWYDGMSVWHTTKPFPIRPVWPGFAINTIFYAAVLWVLLAFPGAVRRFVRRRRGRCTRCGYDLRGQVADDNRQILCPECGTPGLRNRMMAS
jgi:hypothetical protein